VSVSDALAPSRIRAAPLEWFTLARVNPKYLIIFFITLILVLGEWRYSILGGYVRLATTLGVCLATETVLSLFIRGRLVNLGSAYISGISLSLLVKPQSNLLWPFFLGAVLAITSKYVLTYRNRHLWNPSNFAIGLMLLLAPHSVAILSHQWGNELATNAVIWAVGLLIVTRARMFHVTMTYVAGFLLFALARNAIVGGPLLAEIAPLTGPMYQLFVFFMITDPRTTVGSRSGRMVVAGLVAVVEASVRLAGDLHIGLFSPLYPSPPILALFIVGPIAMWVDLFLVGRRERSAHVVPGA
jgi:Na+-translocating ferredoxin:NAD+ oxidoreductase RnfD subunit